MLSRLTFCLFLLACRLPAATATISIDAGTPVNTFIPLNAFGVNVGYFDGATALWAIQSKVQAAGTRFIRYPGGSSSDDFHWNGRGSFDAANHWVPDDTSYSISWAGSELHRGTTSSYGIASLITDGDLSTYWLSNADTDHPNAQWVYVDLGAAHGADGMVITWGLPYATQFKVQYWTSLAGWPLPYQSQSNLWADTSAGVLAGSGGAQAVSFTATPAARWFRVLCMASSAVPAQYAVAELKIYLGATQLTVNSNAFSNNQPIQSQAAASSTDPASAAPQLQNLDFETFMAWLHALSPQAKPLITINVGTGTPQEAAAWVHYANVVQKYGILDWEIGNEMEGTWETGGPLCASDYARRYIEYCQAMKAADSGIHIYGPVSGGPYETSGDMDNKTFIQGFVDRLAADPGGNQAADAEGIDFHWYPTYGNTSDSAYLATLSGMKTFAQANLPAMLANHPAAATVPVLMTEFNGGINNHCEDTLVNGIWLADWLGQFVTYFGWRASSQLWDAIEGGDADTNPTGSSLGMLNANAGPWLYQERAHYWALQLLAQRWAIAGDAAPHTLVQATSSSAVVSAYADLRPDGLLSLMVINKDPSNAYDTTLNFSNFAPGPNAARWTMDASTYVWNISASPYHAAPDLAPAQGIETGVAASYLHTFGPYSVTVMQYANAVLPAASATPSPTPAPTAVPTPAPGLMIDDFDDVSRDGPAPSRLNLWGGNWFTSSSATTMDLSFLAPGAASTAYSLSWTCQAASGGWANLDTSLTTTYNAAAVGIAGTQFWALGDGKTYRADIITNSITDYDYYGFNFTPPAGVWTFYKTPFTGMSRQGWGGQIPAPPPKPAANDITALRFVIQVSPGLDTLRLDQISFYAFPTPTVTPTPTATPKLIPTANNSAGDGSGRVLKILPLPNPNPMAFYLQLASPVDGTEIKIYSSAMNCLASWQGGPLAASGYPAWVKVPVPAEMLKSANGIYFAWACGTAPGGGKSKPAPVCPFAVIR